MAAAAELVKGAAAARWCRLHGDPETCAHPGVEESLHGEPRAKKDQSPQAKLSSLFGAHLEDAQQWNGDRAVRSSNTMCGVLAFIAAKSTPAPASRRSDAKR